jgi:ABC-type transporter Mla subunit MlaD
MTYSKIDLTKMNDTSKVFYLNDLVQDLVSIIEGKDLLDIDEVLKQAKQAIKDIEVK